MTTPAGEARAAIRAGRWHGSTAGLAPGFAQANLVVVPRPLAEDFRRYCERNPKPCPVMEALEPGGFEPVRTAPGADLRTDLPRYRVHRRGKAIEEVRDLRALWSPELVAFLLGCSFTFEAALVRAGITLPHLRTGRSVAMYRTSVETKPVGPFRGPLVVSMRWIPEDRVDEVIEISGRYPLAHGAPVHVGDPGALGIVDLARPDYGEAWSAGEREVPAFWACGVTPQAVAAAAGIERMITHAPGCMFITDVPEAALATSLSAITPPETGR